MNLDRAMTLEEVAQEMGMSPQRVQQIEKEALRKLKKESGKLREIYEAKFVREGVKL